MITRTVIVEVSESYFNELTTARGDMDTRSEVVMVLPRPNGKVLVSTKDFYPAGTFRIPSGGIHPGETPEQAFIRETMEETGLDSKPETIIGKIEHDCRCDNKCAVITSYIVLGSPTSQPPHPIDESERISEYREVDIRKLRDIATQLRNLPGRWHGFGQFRATPHELTADFLTRIIHQDHS